MYNHAKATALKCADERDDAQRVGNNRTEALLRDLLTRTEERDAARAEARKYAETRKFADDLQTELAAAKIALAELNAEADRWATIARDAVYSAGVIRGQLESLAALTTKSGSAAVCLAEIILAETKPCTP